MLVVFCTTGCQTFRGQAPPVNMSSCLAPRELKKSVLPAYVIEPPDVLLIEAIHAIPKQPYHLQPFDTLVIQVGGTPAEAPIAGIFPIGADGTVLLGQHYGAVYLSGKTVSEAKDIVAKQLAATLVKPEVSLSLADSAARQKVSGPHLVAMDGTVTLGTYGSVSVVGLTVAQAKSAVQTYLLKFFESLEISLEVNGYNSKVYYIVTQGAGMGDGVYRFPITGNETVLDAISQINGLKQVSSKRIWIARPTDCVGTVQRYERQLGGYYRQRQRPLELPNSARRPCFRGGRRADRVGHGHGQASRSGGTRIWLLDIWCWHRDAILWQGAGRWRKRKCGFLALSCQQKGAVA